MTDDEKRKQRRAALEDYFKRNPERASYVAGAAFDSFLSARYPGLDFSNAKIVLEDGREIALDSEEGIQETAKLIATIPGGPAFVEGALQAHEARRMYELGAKLGEKYAAQRDAAKQGPAIFTKCEKCGVTAGWTGDRCPVCDANKPTVK